MRFVICYYLPQVAQVPMLYIVKLKHEYSLGKQVERERQTERARDFVTHMLRSSG